MAALALLDFYDECRIGLLSTASEYRSSNCKIKFLGEIDKRLDILLLPIISYYIWVRVSFIFLRSINSHRARWTKDLTFNIREWHARVTRKSHWSSGIGDSQPSPICYILKFMTNADTSYRSIPLPKPRARLSRDRLELRRAIRVHCRLMQARTGARICLSIQQYSGI